MFDTNRTLLIECVPSGKAVPQGAHRAARNNVVAAMIEHFFKLQAGGRFKHVYYDSKREKTNPHKIDIRDFLYDDDAHTDVDAVIAAILKLFVKEGMTAAKDFTMMSAYDKVKRDDKLPPDSYNDLLCDDNLSFDYLRGGLQDMFKKGGFFLLVCDCNGADERKTMRIRLCMLVIREKATNPHTFIPPTASGCYTTAVPSPSISNLDGEVEYRIESRKGIPRDNAYYGYNSTLAERKEWNMHGVRWLLEAICVFKTRPLPKDLDQSRIQPFEIGNFEYYDAATKTIRTSLTGSIALQFLDIFARVNGIPEIRLESVFRSLQHTYGQTFDFVYGPAPTPGETNRYNVGDWIRRYNPPTSHPGYMSKTGGMVGGGAGAGGGNSTASYSFGVIVGTDPEHRFLKVRFWSENAEVYTVKTIWNGVSVQKNDFLPPEDVQLTIVPVADPLGADLVPGTTVAYKESNVNIIRRDEFSCVLNNGAKVPYNIQKIPGGSVPDKITYLHEFYYRMGYDFEESNVLYAASSLRNCMTYGETAWYKHDPSDDTRADNLDPDDKKGRMEIIKNRKHHKSMLIPPPDKKSPGPVGAEMANVHPIENMPAQGDPCSQSRDETLISMIRRVTGIYKPEGVHRLQVSNGDPDTAPQLIGRDYQPQPKERHMQSLTLQSIANDLSTGAGSDGFEEWEFIDGALDKLDTVSAADLGPAAFMLASQSAQATSSEATISADLNATYALLVAQQTRMHHAQGFRTNTGNDELELELERKRKAESSYSGAGAGAGGSLHVHKRIYPLVNTQAAGVLAIAQPDKLVPFGTVVASPSLIYKTNCSISTNSILGMDGASARQAFPSWFDASAATTRPSAGAGAGAGAGPSADSESDDDVEGGDIFSLKRRAVQALRDSQSMSGKEKRTFAKEFHLPPTPTPTSSSSSASSTAMDQVHVRHIGANPAAAGGSATTYTQAPVNVQESTMLAVLTPYDGSQASVVLHERGTAIAIGPVDNTSSVAPPSVGRRRRRPEEVTLETFDVRSDGLTNVRAQPNRHGFTADDIVSSIENILKRPFNNELRQLILDTQYIVRTPLTNRDKNQLIRAVKSNIRLINQWLQILPEHNPLHTHAVHILHNIQLLASLAASADYSDRNDFVKKMRKILIAIERMDEGDFGEVDDEDYDDRRTTRGTAHRR